MVIVEPGVDDADYNPVTSRRNVPRLYSAYVGARRKQVLQTPLQRETRVVGIGGRMPDIIRFHINDVTLICCSGHQSPYLPAPRMEHIRTVRSAELADRIRVNQL